MKHALVTMIALLPLAVAAATPAPSAAPKPPPPPPDLTTLEYLADWPAADETPAPDDPLLKALDALIESTGDDHETPKPTR